MTEFRIGENIKLKLEDGRTNIYIKEELFTHCKYLLITLEVENLEALSKIKSVDDLPDIAIDELNLNHSLEDKKIKIIDIPITTRFWAHCSNLQGWAENNYDTRLLHSNLAFPLLKKLTEVGDLDAKRVFKEEIIKRLNTKKLNVSKFLILEGYLDEFSGEELGSLIEDNSVNLLEILVNCEFEPQILIDLLRKLKKESPKIFRKKLLSLLEEGKYNYLIKLIACGYFSELDIDLKSSILIDLKINYFQILMTILRKEPYLINDIISHLTHITDHNEILSNLRSKIEQSFEEGNEMAIIFILISGLIEVLFDEMKQSYFYNKINKQTLIRAEKEITTLQSLKEIYIRNLEYLKKLKKIIRDKMNS